MDAPLSATGNLRNTRSMQSGAAVCPASLMRRSRPRACIVLADRIQITPASSKPYVHVWFLPVCPTLAPALSSARGPQSGDGRMLTRSQA